MLSNCFSLWYENNKVVISLEQVNSKRYFQINDRNLLIFLDYLSNLT